MHKSRVIFGHCHKLVVDLLKIDGVELTLNHSFNINVGNIMNLGMCKMSVAGQFYPAKIDELRSKIEEMINFARRDNAITPEAVRAVILPHAGYDYSARTAIKGLLAIKPERVKRIVLMAPSHRHGFQGAATAAFDGFETPDGAVNCDIATIEQLINTSDSSIHDLPQVFQGEHALEVQLPLLRHFFGDFQLIPLIIGQNIPKITRAIALELKHLWTPETLWVASSDFTHFGRSFGYQPFNSNIGENLRQLDLDAIERILALDADGFEKYIQRTGATICGHAPIEIMLRAMDSVTAELIDYTNTGEMFNDFSHSVSYASIIFKDA